MGLLRHEAKARKETREYEATVRDVVMKKKEDLESKSASELNSLCTASGFKGLRSKEERVARLLTVWQENDGVDKALALRAEEERRDTLLATDGVSLLKLCSRIGVDPFVKEVMVDRVIRKESGAGQYLRPVLDKDEESSSGKKLDMVDALLANEAKRKKTKAKEMGMEEKIANKRKELKAFSIDDLKSELEEKGIEPCGKKDEMIEALSTAFKREQEAALRKADLKGMVTDELKALVAKKAL